MVDAESGESSDTDSSGSETKIQVEAIPKDERSSGSAKPKPRWAIHANDITYSYGKMNALKCVNLKIAMGEIYGLLGPSGCGKTSLLRCIVGVAKPKSGELFVFGYHPGSSKCSVPGAGVGYMPQDIALYNEFTIRETIEYFGRIFGLSKATRRSRLEFLMKFLDLPDADRRIEALSGGQKRRASLAAALIHNPPLLILDEPTVGVDPLLRETIWNHLVELTSKGEMTVIVTTHYIEEARQANRVGLMRLGQLLIEGTPNSLLSKFQANTLEEVFLKVCQESNNTQNAKSEKKTKSIEVYEKQHSGYKEYNFRDSCNKIVALVKKGSIRLRRNLFELVFQTILPALQIALFCLCIGHHPQGLDIAVYNPDNNYSNKFLNNLNPLYMNLINYSSFDGALDSVKLGKTWGALMFDANYTYYLKKRLDIWHEMDNETLSKSQIRFYCDMTEYPVQALIATQMVNATKSFVYTILREMKLSIPTSLVSQMITSFFSSKESMNKLNLAPEMLTNASAVLNKLIAQLKPNASIPENSTSIITALRDLIKSNNQLSRVSERLRDKNVPIKPQTESLTAPNEPSFRALADPTLEGDIPPELNNHLQDLLNNISSTVFINRQSFSEPFVDIVNPPLYGSMEPSFRDFAAPGLILGITYILAVGLTALAFITDRKGGIMERSLIAGVNPIEILVAHVMIQLAIILVQTALLLVCVFVVFHIELQGSVFLVILLTIVQGFTGMSFGFLISSFCYEEQLAILLAVGSFYPNLILSGIFWPLEGMPVTLRYISYLMPQTMAISALRSIIARGWGFEYFRIWLGFISSFIWAAIFNFSAIFLLVIQR